MRALAVAALLAACADSTSLTTSAVTNGTPASADPTVVAIVERRTACEMPPPEVSCSGILVGPRLVLTAAHCAYRLKPGTLEVFFGSDLAGAGTYVVVSELHSHPGYDPSSRELDVAVLYLAEPAPVAPYPLPTGSVVDLAAASIVRPVGFGITARNAGDAGIKRAGTMMLDAVRATSFDALAGPSVTCDGDSGGPVFATINASEQLVGITARGDAACEAMAFQIRVDAVLDFILPAIDASNAAPVVSVAVEDRACTVDSECPALMTCSGMTHRCEVPNLGAGTFGDACTADSECAATAHCARVWPSGPDACHCFVAKGIAPPPDDGCHATHGSLGALLVLVAFALTLRLARPR